MHRICSILTLGGLCALLLSDRAEAATVLVDPARMLADGERVDFVGENAFKVEETEFGRCLRSVPRKSASGLYESLDVPGQALTHVIWQWRVDRLQAKADIRALQTEDFGATIFFVFGDPSLFNKDVPTLAYTWTGTHVPDGTVLPSLRFHSLRYIQLHGGADVGKWQHETRNVAADFKAIFGREPPPLKHLGIFNDNDQTGESTSALFGSITYDLPTFVRSQH